MFKKIIQVNDKIERDMVVLSELVRELLTVKWEDRSDIASMVIPGIIERYLDASEQLLSDDDKVNLANFLELYFLSKQTMYFEPEDPRVTCLSDDAKEVAEKVFRKLLQSGRENVRDVGYIGLKSLRIEA